MRNLKRALSLTLASVMLLGMMVVGASAKGYPDVDEDDNVEAIEVLQAIEVMRGDDNGDFNPDSPVTRSEMAVVMALLLNLDYQYYETTCPFWDVPTWARPYVGACYANGIVSGYSDNTYGAADGVTAVQAASMMMRALGYFQYAEDYAGNFELSTVRQGTEIGIFNGVGSDATAAMTRNQVAQMALNALRSEMVTFTGTPGFEVGGVTVGYRGEYTKRTGTDSKYNAIAGLTTTILTDNGQYFVQLGEELYNGDLRLKNDDDDFGRPSRRWEYKSDVIGFYVREELLHEQYTAKVTGKNLYDLLGASLLKEYTTEIYIDGLDLDAANAQTYLGSAYNTLADLNRNNDTTVFGTGNGVLTQVFVDNTEKEITIAVINTYLAIADEDYNDRSEDVDVLVYGIGMAARDIYVKTKTDNVNDYAAFTLAEEDFPLVASMEDGDPLLVTVADGVVQTVAVPEVLTSATISSFSTGSSVTTDGVKYNYSSAAEYDWEVLDDYTGIDGNVNLKDILYNIYLDKYGYAIGVDIVEAVNNYVFITAINRGGSHLTNTTADANAIFMDGTMDVIKINMNKSTLAQLGDGTNAILNTWCTYSVDSNNLYTVKEVSRATLAPATTLLNTPVNQPTYVPGGDDNSNGRGKIAQSWTDPVTATEINRTHLSLNGGGVSGNYYRVYGNDNTVYLVAKLDEVDHNNGGTPNYGAISGVSSVTVGVRDADIKVWDMDKANAKAEKNTPTGSIPAAPAYQSYGVYSLYGRDGYVIAAVVVGEDGASSRSLVYVDSSKVKDETDNGSSNTRAVGDGQYTWTREAILNGERTQLTEVGEQLTYLNQLVQYNWYQISFNPDGEVIGVADYNGPKNEADIIIKWELDNAVADSYNAHSKVSYSNVWNGDKAPLGEFINNITHLEKSLDEYSTVLYTQDFTDDKPYMDTNKGNTLYVTTKAQQGVWVTDDVKVALIEYRNNTMQTTFASGVNQLRNIVRTLNEKDSGFDYTISAVVTGSGATSVIICDWTNTYNVPSVTNTFDLKLYGTLFTGEYVTGDGNAVVTVNGGAVEPVGTGTDRIDSYTQYRINSGDTVVINDLDIKTDADFLTNLRDLGVTLRRNNTRHTLSFQMPKADVWIIGEESTIKEDISAEIDESKPELESLNIMLGDADATTGDTIKDASAGDSLTVKIGNENDFAKTVDSLELNHRYTVTLGAYRATYTATYQSHGDERYLTFEYELTAQDILNGYVMVYDIVEAVDEDETPDKDIEVESVNVVISSINAGDTLAEKVSWDTDGVTVTVAGDVSEAGEATLTLTITAEEGYVLAEGYTVSVNNGDITANKGDGNTWTVTVPVREEGTEDEVIDSIGVTVPKIKAGTVLENVEIECDNENVNITHEWSAETAEGETVTLTLTVTAKMGYALAENFTVTVNDGDITAKMNDDGTWTVTVTVEEEGTEEEEIASIDVTVPKITAETDLAEVSVTCANENVTIDAEWTGDPAVDETVTLKLTVEANEGYVLADDFAVTVNEKEATPNGDGTWSIEIAVAGEGTVDGTVPAPTKSGTVITVPFYGTKPEGDDLWATIKTGEGLEDAEKPVPIGTVTMVVVGETTCTVEFKEYFKITLPDGEVYASGSENSSNIVVALDEEQTIDGKFLTKGSAPADTPVAIAEDGTVTGLAKLDADIELVAAINVKHTTATPKVALGPNLTADEIGANVWVAEETTLYVSNGADNTADKIVYLMSGTGDTAVKIDETIGSANGYEFSFVVSDEWIPSDGTAIDIKIETGYQIVLDDGTEDGFVLGLWDGSTNGMTVPYTNKIAVNDVLAPLNGKTHIAYNASTNNAGVTTSSAVAGQVTGFSVGVGSTNATAMTNASKDGVILLNKVYKVTVGAGDINEIVVGDDEAAIDFATNSSGVWVDASKTLTVTAKTDTEGTCITADVDNDGPEVIIEAGMSGDNANPAKIEGYELTGDTEFDTLVGVATLTLEGVNALVDEAGATAVGDIDLNTAGQTYASAEVTATKKNNTDNEPVKIESSVKIAEGDEVVLTVVLTPESNYTLAFVKSIVLDGIDNENEDYKILIGDPDNDGKVTITITFEAPGTGG